MSAGLLPDPDAPILNGVANALEDYVGRRHGIFGNPAPTWLLDSLHDEGLTVVREPSPAEQVIADLLDACSLADGKPPAWRFLTTANIREIVKGAGA